MGRINGKLYGRMELIRPNVFITTVSEVLPAIRFIIGFGAVHVC
jgi:hypothetical protein